MDVSELAEEILAVVRSDYKAAKMQRPFAWDMEALKARIENALRRTVQKGEEGAGRHDSH